MHRGTLQAINANPGTFQVFGQKLTFNPQRVKVFNRDGRPGSIYGLKGGANVRSRWMRPTPRSGESPSFTSIDMERDQVRQRGFTLVEVMIACAIVAILAALAYPSYINAMQKSRRSDAKSALVGAAGQMERYFTERSTYATATLGSGGVYPSTSLNGYYTLTDHQQDRDDLHAERGACRAAESATRAARSRTPIRA